MDIEIRELIQKDRNSLNRLFSKITVFDADDRAIAMELVDVYLDNPPQEDYEFFVAADKAGEVIGYICYGPTPLTEGTYDLYWIAVNPAFAGQGLGTLLLKEIERAINNNGGRLIIIETSSSQQYGLARNFYVKNGYILAETIKDFYRPGEDRVTFVKYL